MTNQPTERGPGSPSHLSVADAAVAMGIEADAIVSLAKSGLLAHHTGPQGLEFALSDLKAFLALHTDDAAEGDLDLTADDVLAIDPDALLTAIAQSAGQMANKAFDIFVQVFPDSTEWSVERKGRFLDQAGARFEAIIEIARQRDQIDSVLMEELADVGSAAAWSGASLPEMLVTLRISRDLVVQTAVETAEAQGRHWGLALSLVLTQILPATDRLTDAVASGYWAATVDRENESQLRYEAIVEHSSEGICETDLDGFIRYHNPAFLRLLGAPASQFEGADISTAILFREPGFTFQEFLPPPEEGRVATLDVRRLDGVDRSFEIRIGTRRGEGGVKAGYTVVLHDVTASRRLEEQKNDFLAMMVGDLRQPLTSFLAFGAILETHADDMHPPRMRQIGESIRRQSERMARLVDDLSDVSRLDSDELAVAVREVALAPAVENALVSLHDISSPISIEVDPDIRVVADPRRLEQVVANLAENAVVHGEGLVRVQAKPMGPLIEISVCDRGKGVDPPLLATLFERVSAIDGPRQKPNVGLPLVRGLVEAMGGRVWYEMTADGPAFRFTLPAE